MMMKDEQIREVSEALQARNGLDEFIFAEMEAVGPPGFQIKKVAELLVASGVPTDLLQFISLRFRLRPGGNPPSRPWCVVQDCPVRGHLAVEPASLPADVPAPDQDSLRAVAVAANLSSTMEQLLVGAEVQPMHLEALRQVWITEASRRGYKDVSEADVKLASEGLYYSVGLGPFYGTLIVGCKGQTCPGSPKVRPG